MTLEQPKFITNSECYKSISDNLQYLQAGNFYQYDADFSKLIGGYKKGAVIKGSDGRLYQSILDNNIEDPIHSNKWIAGCFSIKQELSNPDGLKLIGQCSDIMTLRKIEPEANNQRIYVTGYNKDSKVGGGYFFYDEFDTTTKDDSGTVIVTVSGKRWKRVEKTINIYMFGAVGDGVTDDSKAFNLAFNSNIEIINIPNASFYIDKIVGNFDYENNTKWIGNSSNIYITKNGGFMVRGTWGFSDIRFIPTSPKVPFAIKSSNQKNDKCYIKKCKFYGDAPGNAFDVCIDLYNIWYSNFDELYINNSGLHDFTKQYYAGTGIRFSYSVNNTLSNSYIGCCEKGIELSKDLIPKDITLTHQHSCEGIMITNNVIIANLCGLAVYEGYFINVLANVIDIPLKATTNIVYFACTASKLSENWIATSVGTIYIGPGESVNTALDGSSNTVSGNVLRSGAESTNNVVTVGKIGLFKFSENQVTYGNCGLFASSTGSNWLVSNNVFASQNELAYDLHTVGYVKASANKLYARPGNTLTKYVATSAVISPNIYHGIAGVNLNAQSIVSNNITHPQTFLVEVPDGYFIEAPETATATLATGRILGITRYLKSESTATTLAFSFVSIGNDIIEGVYNFNIIAMDRNSSF